MFPVALTLIVQLFTLSPVIVFIPPFVVSTDSPFTLMEVGAGKREPGCIERAIATGDRLLLGQTAPACGLTLMRVLYDGDEEKALGYFA